MFIENLEKLKNMVRNKKKLDGRIIQLMPHLGDNLLQDCRASPTTVGLLMPAALDIATEFSLLL